MHCDGVRGPSQNVKQKVAIRTWLQSHQVPGETYTIKTQSGFRVPLFLDSRQKDSSRAWFQSLSVAEFQAKSCEQGPSSNRSANPD